MLSSLSSRCHAPMVYAVIIDPGAIVNPDVPAYQSHVHDRLNPPALISLQMREVDLCIDVTIARAEVTLRARWWVHYVPRSRVEQHLPRTSFFPSPILGACHRLSECLHHR
jgi:hypothetical protein